MFGQMPELRLDIICNINGERKTFQQVPSNSAIADFGDKSFVIADNKDSLLAILGSFLYDPLMYAVNWFNDNISFSYVVGMLSGFLIIDFFYSSKLYIKIRRYAKNNNIVVRYEKLKTHIKEETKKAGEKYSFLFPFRQSRKLIEYLNSYRDKK